jgi:nucleoside-diphosphate-sugar epimerase
MKPTIFIFGLGYCGLALAKACLATQWRVLGTCQSAEKALALSHLGIEVQRFDSTAAVLIPDETTHILSTIAPHPEWVDPVIHFHRQRLQALPALAWLGYLSATSVYGDHQGAWVDETTEATPQSTRGRLRLDAEQQWLALSAPVASHIFRLSGIYGPGRNTLEQLKQGTAQRIVKTDQVFSRIHVEDIVAMLLASIEKPHPCEIFNAADDHPCSSEEIINYLCDRYQLPQPPAVDFTDPSLSPMQRSFYQECRRICNRKIKDKLGVVLKYPDYRAYYEKDAGTME